MKVRIEYGTIQQGAEEYGEGDEIDIPESKLSRFGSQVSPVIGISIPQPPENPSDIPQREPELPPFDPSKESEQPQVDPPGDPGRKKKGSSASTTPPSDPQQE